MKYAITLFLMAALFIGCSSPRQRLDGMNVRKDQPVPEKIIRKVVDVDAGKAKAETMWQGFQYAGTLGLVGGLAALWFTGSWKVLIAGAIIAAIPPVATLFIYPLLPWFAGFSLIAGVMLLAYLGYVLWDRVEDDIRADRQSRCLNGASQDQESAEQSPQEADPGEAEHIVPTESSPDPK